MRFGGPAECGNSSNLTSLSFSTAGISILLTCIAAPCNLLICLAVYRDPYKNLKTPFNLIILNITLADLIQGIAVMPISVAFHVLEGLALSSDALIKALHLFTFLSCTASVLSIAALAVDRCTSITNPFRYRAKLTVKRSVRVSLLIWFASVALSFLYFQVDFIAYTFVYVNSILLLTLLVLLLVQVQVWRSLRRNRERIAMISLPSYNTTIYCRGEGKILQKRDAKVTYTFLALLSFFLVLNAPAFIFAYLLNFCGHCNCNTIHIFRDIHFLSLLFPSSINPFIFGWRLPNFKQALRKVLLLRASRRGALGEYAAREESAGKAIHVTNGDEEKRTCTSRTESIRNKSRKVDGNINGSLNGVFRLQQGTNASSSMDCNVSLGSGVNIRNSPENLPSHYSADPPRDPPSITPWYRITTRL